MSSRGHDGAASVASSYDPGSTARALQPPPPPPQKKNEWGNDWSLRPVALQGLMRGPVAFPGRIQGQEPSLGLSWDQQPFLGWTWWQGPSQGLNSGPAFIEATEEASGLGMASVAMTKAASFRRVSMDKTRQTGIFSGQDKTYKYGLRVYDSIRAISRSVRVQWLVAWLRSGRRTHSTRGDPAEFPLLLPEREISAS